MARLLVSLIAAFGMVFSLSAGAETLPRAPNSPLANVAFADQPVALPVTSAFQTAMHTVATDLGKHCGATEAYGWRLAQTEQQRVNAIFNATVEALRGQAYTMAPQTPNSASREVTVFTAQKNAQELLVLWSAGESGLVLLICETLPGVTDATTQEEVTPDATAKEKTKKAARRKASKATAAAETAGAVNPDALRPAAAATQAPAQNEPAPVPSPSADPAVKAMLDSLPEVPEAPIDPPPAPSPALSGQPANLIPAVSDPALDIKPAAPSAGQ